MAVRNGRADRPAVGLSAAARAEAVVHPGYPDTRLGAYVRWVRLPDGVVWQTLDVWRLDGLIHGRGEGSSVPAPLPATDLAGLQDPTEGERFVERVFAHGRLSELSDRALPHALVDFHTRHKLQLFAHDPTRTRELGRLVADPGPETVATYRWRFAEIMATPPTRGRRVDALLHAAGHLPGKAAGSDLLARIEAYRRGDLPFRAALDRLAELAAEAQVAYLLRQTFLDPFPVGLLATTPWHPSTPR